jgi:hypothetical protein
LAIAAHTSHIWTQIVGIINPGVVNELPSAGEASDLWPLPPRVIDGVKTDDTDCHESTLSRWYGYGCVTQQWHLHRSNKYGKPEL